MVRFPRLMRLCLAIISMVVVAMPVSAAHLHLCFDGGEPPATLHSGEDGVHHADIGADAAHHDVDVSLANSAHAKKFDATLELPVLLTAAFIVLRMPLSEAAISPPDRAATLIPDPQLRPLPPLRAPPV